MHRITDRKAMDLFPHVLYVHVLSHFIPFCINWSPVLTKLLYSKWWSKIKPFLPATQDSHMITVSSLELIYLLSLLGMLHLNLEGSSAIPALNNTCSGQQSQKPQAGIVESQKHRAGRDLKRSFSPSSCPPMGAAFLGWYSSSHRSPMSELYGFPGNLSRYASLSLPDNVFLKMKH